MMGGKIIKETKTPSDKNGVYMAKVEIEGVKKKPNSSFFPKTLESVDVLKVIHEAYENKKHIGNGLYEGTTTSEMYIQMYLKGDGTIATAFPIYQK